LALALILNPFLVSALATLFLTGVFALGLAAAAATFVTTAEAALLGLVTVFFLSDAF